jgi:hypothetical protein
MVIKGNKVFLSNYLRLYGIKIQPFPIIIYLTTPFQLHML